MADKTRLSFSYPDKQRAQLEALAKKDGRKLQGYLRLILDKEVKELMEKGGPDGKMHHPVSRGKS